MPSTTYGVAVESLLDLRLHSKYHDPNLINIRVGTFRHGDSLWFSLEYNGPVVN